MLIPQYENGMQSFTFFGLTESTYIRIAHNWQSGKVCDQQGCGLLQYWLCRCIYWQYWRTQAVFVEADELNMD